MSMLKQTYAGLDGMLEYSDGRHTECEYEITQDEAGDVSIRCEHDRGAWVMDESFSSAPSPSRFTAETRDGLRLLLEGEFIQASDPPDSPPTTRSVQVRYHVSGPLMISSAEAENESIKARFALLNLAFVGNEMNRRDLDGGGYRMAMDTMRFRLGDRNVAIVRVEHYEDTVARLRATKGVAATAILHADLSTLQDFQSLREDVKRLCFLLSLATGCKVVCAADDACSPSGRLVGGSRTSVPTRPFSSFALVDTRQPSALPQFIEATFNSYLALETEYEMGRVIDARVDAIASGFLETRTLMAGVLADYLTRRYSIINGNIAAKKFRDRLKFMVERLCPDVIASIDEFIKTRNHLAHEMRFAEDAKRSEYRAVMHVVNRLLLGLLGYEGRYADCRSWTIVPARKSGRNEDSTPG
jgi:hypothetical protein